MSETVFRDAGNALEDYQVGDQFILTGFNTTFTLWKGSENSVFAYGDNETIQFEYAGYNSIYAEPYAPGLNLQFGPSQIYGSSATVYNAQLDPTTHVTLADLPGAGQLQQGSLTYTETPYFNPAGFEWGTELQVTSSTTRATDTVYFARDAHVTVVHAT